MTNLFLAVTCLLMASVLSQSNNNPDMVCQQYREYCNHNGFPSCCAGLKCQGNQCAGLSDNNNNFGCVSAGGSCDNRKCCPGAVCQKTNGIFGSNVCTLLKDLSN